MAARNGAPNLEPESNSSSDAELLTPGGQTKLGGGSTGIVATVSPGVNGTAQTTGGSENVAPVTNEGGADVGSVGGAPTPSDPPKDASPAAEPTTAATAGSNPAKDPPAAESGTGTPASSDPATPGTDAKSDATPASADKSGDTKSSGDSKNAKDSKNKKESSSKKKGIHKLIPW